MVVVFTILGIASVLYGVSVMLIQSGTSFFAVWYVLGAGFLACAWATHVHAWDAIPVAAKYVCGAVVGVALAGLLLTQGLIVSQFGSKGEPNLDYLVVLGAQVRADGSPSAVLQYRLDAALDYLADNPSTRCIVSGGQGPNEPMPEALGMKDYLVRHSVSEDRIIIEDQSGNTTQNIANSLQFANPARDRIGVVTNNFHLYRAVGIARKAGVEHVCGVAAYSTPFYLPNNMLREGLGIIKDFFAGNL